MPQFRTESHNALLNLPPSASSRLHDEVAGAAAGAVSHRLRKCPADCVVVIEQNIRCGLHSCNRACACELRRCILVAAAAAPRQRDSELLIGCFQLQSDIMRNRPYVEIHIDAQRRHRRSLGMCENCRDSDEPDCQETSEEV